MPSRIFADQIQKPSGTAFSLPVGNGANNQFIQTDGQGNLSFEKSRTVNRESAIKLVPNVEKQKLKGGVVYFDGQFDDSRLGIDIALTSEINNAVLINYMSVESLIKENGKIKGVIAHDSVNNSNFSINSDNVINATGVFSRSIMELDSNKLKTVIRPSQGVHLVVDKCFLNGNFGILVPKTSDGRVLFAVPWQDHVIIGTTDTVVDNPSFNPESTKEEIDFIFKRIDSKKDGVVDREEFLKFVLRVHNALYKIKDLIKHENLEIEDILYKMNINKKNEKLTKRFDFLNFKMSKKI